MQESQNDRPHAEEGGAGAAGRGQGQRREHQGQEAKQVLWFGLSPGSQPSRQRERQDGSESRADDATRASDSCKRAGKATHTPKEAERELLGAGKASGGSSNGSKHSKRCDQRRRVALTRQ